MPHNENSRVKIPALVHFTRLGYKYISLRKYEGVIDDDTNILVDVLCDAINRINATSLTTTDVQKIVNALKAMLENDDLGREFYSVLINGYNGLKLIDFEDFGGTVNSYHVVTEMTCKNGSDEFRPDITPLTHKRLRETPPPIAGDVALHQVLTHLKHRVDSQVLSNSHLMDNEPYFMQGMFPMIKQELDAQHLKYSAAQIKYIGTCISNEYFTERNFAL